MRDSAVQSVAVGFFDGVHLGHRAILAGADVALTFRRHPLEVLTPARAPRLIMTLDDRLAAIRACGVRDVLALDFTPALAALSPEAFAARHLVPLGSPGALPRIRCGANWRFGAGGAGDADWLRAHGYAVTTVPYATFGGAPVSSSRIRAALAAGDVESANAMLGHPFRAHGERQKGKGLGAKIGFPTVNLLLPELEIDLPRGVYEVSVGGVRGIANYGVAPTLGDRRWPTPVLEIHFPGCDAASVPTGALAVDFMRFVRHERRFVSLDALRLQIAQDCRGLMRRPDGAPETGTTSDRAVRGVRAVSETELLEFAADVLGVPSGRLSLETTYASLPEWDSMAQLRLVMAFQSRLGVEIPFEEVTNVTSLWEFYRRVNGLSPKKAVAVDLDGTLWEGVVGEDGLDAIRPKTAFLEELKALKARGVLLTILSKNNAEDVRPVFAAGRLAPLEEGDFIFPQVNWEPKADNLRRLARELNLGLDAFVFVDDNPAERLEMAMRLPGVTVAAFPPTLAAYFPTGVVTAEDLSKTEEYRAEAARREFLSAESAVEPSDVWRALGCRLDVHALRPEEAPRVAQLSQKANQFCVCTNRYAVKDVERLARDGAVYAVRAGDRFGDQGLVAFVIVRGGEVLDFTMSCRVAGRGLEERLWAEVADDLRARGVCDVRATWRRTARNAPVECLFERLGFVCETRTADAKTYRARLGRQAM